MRNQALSKAVITVTVIVVAVSAGLYFFSKRNVENKNVPLKKYMNITYGVSFSYPETYDLTETSVEEKMGETGTLVTLTDKGAQLPKDGEGPTAITVGMYDNHLPKNVKQDPIIDWIMNSSSSNYKLANVGSLGQTQLAGKDAWLYTWNGLYNGTSVVTENNNNIIMFTVTYDGQSDLKKREDFAKILQSVQFNTAGG